MYRKGAQKERELIEKLRNLGFGAVRVAGSGAPDIIAGKKGKFYVIECKYSSKDKIYASKEEIEKGKEIAEKMGAEFLLAVKFSNKKWVFIDAEKLKKFEKGKSIKITKNDIKSLPSVELLLDKNLNKWLKQ